MGIPILSWFCYLYQSLYHKSEDNLKNKYAQVSYTSQGHDFPPKRFFENRACNNMRLTKAKTNFYTRPPKSDLDQWVVPPQYDPEKRRWSTNQKLLLSIIKLLINLDSRRFLSQQGKTLFHNATSWNIPTTTQTIKINITMQLLNYHIGFTASRLIA